MSERVELGHRVVDLAKQITLFRRLAEELSHDLAVALAQARGRVTENALLTDRGAPGALEKCIGDAGECGDDNHRSRILRFRDRYGVGDGVGIGERRATELMDGYGRHC